ncbi:MAG: methionine--tRNA ligase [Patescibacteria group bacterium]|nr:methionine--tRNA ligase [bacterium]MDZ4241026.1 methionine--tRNA ligase [Patescibacteria group bacterium]
MESRKPFYITTTLPYVNAKPHLGHAVELVRADVAARHKASLDFDVFFNTGTDEHGQKIAEIAKKENIDTQVFVDKMAEHFKEFCSALAVGTGDYTFSFIRTTNAQHVSAAQEFWRQSKEKGFIEKKKYTVKYCVGCELEKTDSELVDGRCLLHSNREIELRDEENYFFKFSSFQKQLLNLYHSRSDFVVPATRLNEIEAFVSRGLEDFSISRLKEKMSWGIPVPNDPDHVMYVWFDALVNYISAIGWPQDKEKFNKWWNETGGVVQYCGKDNLRQQAAMWQAMLMSLGITPSKQIVIDGFVTGEGGVKMSKSLGNVIDPLEIVKEYGTDALRYYVLRELHPFEDSIFTSERFKETYNANLANGLGNLVSRVMKMASTYNIRLPKDAVAGQSPEFEKKINSFDLKGAMDFIWAAHIMYDDAYIQKEEPFKKIKTDPEKAKIDIEFLLTDLFTIANHLSSFMPETSKKILSLLKENKAPETPLFLRKQ